MVTTMLWDSIMGQNAVRSTMSDRTWLAHSATMPAGVVEMLNSGVQRFSGNRQLIPQTAIRKTVQLPWSRSYRGHRPRQGSRFAPTLPCQALYSFGVRIYSIRQRGRRIGWPGRISSVRFKVGTINYHRNQIINPSPGTHSSVSPHFCNSSINNAASRPISSIKSSPLSPALPLRKQQIGPTECSAPTLPQEKRATLGCHRLLMLSATTLSLSAWAFLIHHTQCFRPCRTQSFRPYTKLLRQDGTPDNRPCLA